MTKHPGRVIAVGLLCAIAATVAVWSGPLESASGSLHTSTPALAASTASSHSSR
jgi:hypothetical protein